MPGTQITSAVINTRTLAKKSVVTLAFCPKIDLTVSSLLSHRSEVRQKGEQELKRWKDEKEQSR